MMRDYSVLDGIKVTFSKNCCSGIVSIIGKQCECWRCRAERKLPADEKLAEAVCKEAQSGMRRWVTAQLAR